MKKKKLEPEIVQLDHGAEGCFLGPKSAKKTLVWFHGKCSSARSSTFRVFRPRSGVGSDIKGPETNACACAGGGYNFPAGPPHWDMAWECIQVAKKHGEDLRVMLLAYGKSLSRD